MSQAILLLGFGGPPNRQDVRPFLASVLRRRPTTPERIEQVVAQYEAIGGRSPYNDLAAELAAALAARTALPVYVGHRHSTPGIADTFGQMARDGITDAVAVPLAAYRSPASWNEYLTAAAAAYKFVIGRRLRLRYVQPWHAHPLFVEAVAEQVRTAWSPMSSEFKATARFFFTAHSIPVEMDAASGYSKQVEGVARRVMARMGANPWEVAYQSRSGKPGEPWLEPDVAEVLKHRSGAAFIVPVGFLMDHVEVLYDLDVRARESAEAAGGIYARAKTVGTHPTFVKMLADLINTQKTYFPAGPAGRGPRRIAVVGAGITGLAAAHRLFELAREAGEEIELTVLEGGARAGGVIETWRRDGYLCEAGPDSFLMEKPSLIALARRLGLEAAILGTNRSQARSFVVRRSKLYPTPAGFYLLAPSNFASLAGKLAIPPRRGGGDESLASFVRRRFGREMLDRIAQPMVAGIYSADPEKLSLEATFPRFLEMEAKSGSVIRALRALRRPADRASGPRYGLFAAFTDGMESLVEKLLSLLPAGALRLRSGVTRLRRSGHTWRVTINGKEEIEADAVCLALPAYQAANLVREIDPKLGELLMSIPYNDVATVNVGIDRSRVGHPLDGFGFVVPIKEGRSLSGCTFSSVKFSGRAPKGKVLLRAFVGGAAFTLTDQAILEAVQKDLAKLLRFPGTPDWMDLRRYPSSMPQYTLGHKDRAAQIAERAGLHQGLALAGNGYQGIGLPDCVAQGQRAADHIFSIKAVR